MGEKVLICVPNWIGDSVMSMPAVRAYRLEHPGAVITVLAKPGVCPLWEMQSAVDGIVAVSGGFAGTFATGEMLASHGSDRCFVLPNSFRSAFIPFIGGIPRSRGSRGRFRRFMLSEIVDMSGTGSHQSEEYFRILGLEPGVREDEGALLNAGDVPKMIADELLSCLDRTKKTVGLMPGAARGESKRWPAEYFSELAGRLNGGHNLILLGSRDESVICEKIQQDFGDGNIVSFAGRTSLKESAALLKMCDLVVCNDSGGMHLAAAAGAKVVAIYGITDPAVTGPLGSGHKLLIADGVNGSRDIPRVSARAAEALRSIKPDAVYAAVMEILE